MHNQTTVRPSAAFPLPPTAGAAVLTALLSLTGATSAWAQSIVKWVDAQGQTHYSDHAPSGQDIEKVSVHVSRSASTPAAKTSSPVTANNPNDAAAARAADEERRQAERREAEAASKEQADKDLVARCNQAREIYCNEGADTIRQREATRAELQYADAISARQDRISRGQVPGVLPPPPP